MEQNKPIGIIGAGIVGLLMALKLSKLNYKTIIFEKREKVTFSKGREVPLMIHNYAIQSLKSAGINIEEESRVINSLGYISQDKIKTVPFKKGYMILFNRQVLFEILCERAKNDPNITIYFGKEYNKIDYDRAKLYFEKQIFELSWIFACDGANSNTRLEFVKNRKVDFHQETDFLVYYEVRIPNTKEFKDDVLYFAYQIDSQCFIYKSFSNQKYMTVIWFVNKILLQDKNDIEIEQLFKTLFPKISEGIEIVDINKQNLLMMRLWTNPNTVGKVTLMGDASFNQSPANGTGLNIILQILEDLLSKIQQEGLNLPQQTMELDETWINEILASQESTFIKRQHLNSNSERIELLKQRKAVINYLEQFYQDKFISFENIIFQTTARYSSSTEYYYKQCQICNKILSLDNWRDIIKRGRDERVGQILDQYKKYIEIQMKCHQEALDNWF